MIAVMAEITEKQDWEKKVLDANIVDKWRAEAVGDEKDFSNIMFDSVSLLSKVSGSYLRLTFGSALRNFATVHACCNPQV